MFLVLHIRYEMFSAPFLKIATRHDVTVEPNESLLVALLVVDEGLHGGGVDLLNHWLQRISHRKSAIKEKKNTES
jgi:hypothetical protein